MSYKNFTLILKSVSLIAPQVRHFIFEREDCTPFQFIPGQFITLHIPTTEKILKRSYSIANAYINNNSLIELAASYVTGGIASQYLFSMNLNEKIEATGPFGRLTLRDEHPARYILVATGTGITPYRSMLIELERCLKQQENLNIVLLFGVRTPKDVLYGNEFIAFAKKNLRFEFRIYYSRWNDQSLAQHEYSGYVLNAFSDLQPNPQQDIFYLCGNPNMIDEVFALLIKQGVATENVRREKYISSH